jgi:DNA-directed RNA polymerase subunit RPC12/RpoP
MKTIAKLILIAGLIVGAAVPVIAGPGPEYWQRMKTAEEFAKLKAGDKVLYVCNQCQTVTEKTIASPAEAMEHCKEGAMLTCPSCKEKVRVVVKGPPKNQSVTREVTYVNDKGEACFFVAKQPDKK